MNVHDEIMCVTHPDHVEPVRSTVRRGVEMYRPQVPLIGMTWFEGMPDWSGKKSAGDPVKIRCKEMLEIKHDKENEGNQLAGLQRVEQVSQPFGIGA
jgi:hypothetical protein